MWCSRSDYSSNFFFFQSKFQLTQGGSAKDNLVSHAIHIKTKNLMLKGVLNINNKVYGGVQCIMLATKTLNLQQKINRVGKPIYIYIYIYIQ